MAKSGEITPMMKHFMEVKSKYADALLLYRVGDFYETYGEDAVISSKVLGIVLTKRSNSNENSMQMAGFPHHSLDSYLPRLVAAGYKVAVCDQLEDPKLNGRKLVKRGVTELVTPGVAFNEQILDVRENNFIAALCRHGQEWGIAILDVTTGSFRVTQGNAGYIGTLLDSSKPKEIVVCRDLKKTVADEFGSGYYFSYMDEWAFVYDSAVEKLKKQFEVETLKGYAVTQYPLGISSAGALMVYLDVTRHSKLKNICSISRIDKNDFVWMDKFTFHNLEIFSTSKISTSLTDILDKCSTPMGARMLRQWLAMPLINLAKIKKRHDIVETFVKHELTGRNLREILDTVGDVERIVSRAAAGRINPKEILHLSKSLAVIPRLKELCIACSDKELISLAGGLDECDDLLTKITTTLMDNAPVQVGKGDVVAFGVNADLDELREIARGGKNYLADLQKREIERTGISSLKIGYNNIFGYYIEVRNAHKDSVPQEWIRKQTLVNAERYITDELKQYEEKILGAEEKIYALETQIYSDLVTFLGTYIAKIQNNSSILAQLDVLQNFALLAIERNYNRPVMTDKLDITIKKGRHPVIEMLMTSGNEYIPNDVSVDNSSQQIIIITGPNMAGKSALLRQTALIVLMAQIGCFVPAESAEIGYVDKIFTRVGASDNISRGESTFMVEMLETSMILHNLSSRSLVLLDEIGRGTSTYDGMSIARAIVEYIHEFGMGAKCLFATHYHELNSLESEYDRIFNYHVSVKEVGKQVIFLRKLLKGGTEHSFGIHVARMAGMPNEVIKSAERTLAALEKTDRNDFGKITKSCREENYGLSLFAEEDNTASEIRKIIENVDINNITPVGAFDVLRELKNKLEN